MEDQVTKRASARMTLALGIFDSSPKLIDRVEALLQSGRSFSGLSRKRAVTCALALIALGGVASLSPSWIALAQTSNSFQVASVKPSGQGSGPLPLSVRVSPNGRLTIGNAPLRWIVRYAYDVSFQSPRMSGEPDWASSALYDIDAEAGLPTGLSEKDVDRRVREMLRSLLAERFKLAIRREDAEIPAYVAVPVKGGLRLKKSKVAEKDCEGNADAHCHQLNGGQGRGLHGTAVSIHDILNFVENWSDRPMVDESRVSGLYEIDTEGWAPLIQRPGPVDPTNKENSLDQITIFSVFEQRIGLKLESRKAKAERYVVERLERPSEN